MVMVVFSSIILAVYQRCTVIQALKNIRLKMYHSL